MKQHKFNIPVTIESPFGNLKTWWVCSSFRLSANINQTGAKLFTLICRTNLPYPQEHVHEDLQFNRLKNFHTLPMIVLNLNWIDWIGLLK